MKKDIIAFAITLVLTGCALFREVVQTPQRSIRDSKCYESQKFKVLQILDDGVLVHICPTSFPSFYSNAFDACIMKGELGFIELDPKKHDLVDEQNVEVPSAKCMQSAGTYSYLAGKDKIKKTIRRVKIVESQIPNPAFK